MNSNSMYAACLILAMVIAVNAGCVAPPKDSPAGQQSSQGGTSGQYITPLPADNPANGGSAQPTQQYLLNATPFSTPQPIDYNAHTWTPTPTISQDQVCLIDFEKIDTHFEVIKTAKTFNLKNPPMYINYTITDPPYITGTKQVTKKYSDQSETVNYKILNPVAYLEVTVRNKDNGTIYSQDGFGKEHGQYLNKTFKVTKSDDMLIEFGAYNVTGVVGVWVKPVGNFDDPSALAGAECKNPGDFGPNTIITATPTPTS